MNPGTQSIYDNLSVVDKHALLSQLIKDYDIPDVHLYICDVCNKTGWMEFHLYKNEDETIRCGHDNIRFIYCSGHCGKYLCEDCDDKWYKNKYDDPICHNCYKNKY